MNTKEFKEEEVLNELESTEISGGVQDEEESETKNYVCPKNGYCPQDQESEEQ
jgi:hypothetical protein